jgi:LPXTG-motif cell wall-anchored protein
MRMPTRLICLLAALAIVVPTAALPAVAFGQSAGDDQYVDPFQDNGKHHNKNQQGGNDNSSSQQGNSQNAAGGGSGSDSGSGGSGSSGTAGASASQSDPNGDDSSLPHTGSGLPEGWLVVGGVILLLGGGFLLRRVWPRPE